MSPHFKVSPDGETVHDARTGLTWQRGVSPDRFTWAEAKRYAARLALDGGGWRLPTIGELFVLADRSRAYPAIDTEAFPDTPSAWFWTSTPYAGDEGGAWNVDFNDGTACDSDDVLDNAVRCVRRG